MRGSLPIRDQSEGHTPQTAQNQSSPSSKHWEESRSKQTRFCFWQYCLWSPERSSDGERPPGRPATGRRNITAIRCFRKNTVTFLNLIKNYHWLAKLILNKGKPWFIYTKNAFYGSNLNQSQMEASWKVKWGGLLPAASRVMDPTKGRESSQAAYRAGFPTERFEEAPD